MSGFYFVFGPNGSFVFDGPRGWQHKGLPNSFWEYGVGDNKISQIDCLAMSDWQGGALFVVYKAKNKDGMRVFSWSEGIEYVAPALLEALDKRDEWKCRVSFGERGHYVAWSQDGIWFKKTRGVADVLDDNRQQIECLTLGVDDSFFLVAKNGKICWNLMGNYPALDAIANDLYNGGVTFVALNPFRCNEFFILFSDGTAVCQGPFSYRSQLESALAEYGITCRAVASQRAAPQGGGGTVPPSAKTPEFAKQLLGQVVGGGVGGVIGAVAQGLAAAAACTVM